MARYDLSDREWTVIAPLLPNKSRGVPRVNDRRVLNAIFWRIRGGAPWRDLPERYGPYTTAYNRYNRWSRRGFWREMLVALAEAGWIAETAALDSTYVKAPQPRIALVDIPEPRLPPHHSPPPQPATE